MALRKLNNLKILIKIFNAVYFVSVYGLLLNTIWYFIRLFLFDRSVALGAFHEIYHLLAFLNLIISMIAVYRLIKYEVVFDSFNILLRMIFIAYAYYMISSFIALTYFELDISVKHFWESGEWTF